MDAKPNTAGVISRRVWVMAALMVGVFLSPLNVVFTSVALPSMRDDFSVGVERVTWVATAYFIPTVVLMPLQSVLGERWGLRRTYVLGLLLLGIAGIFAAMAPSFQWLLASRVLQGIGWSALYPIALILIRVHFDTNRQGEMMGLWESAVGVATIMAPLVGGAIVQFLGWRVVYLALGGLALAGALVAAAAIPSRQERPSFPPFDWPGALSFTLALTLALWGITVKSPLLLLLAGGAGLVWFWYSREGTARFVAPQLFTNRRFISASGAATLRMMIAISALTALPFFFEEVQGVTPATVGTLMLIYSLFLFAGAWPGGRWADRAGARMPGAVGYLAMIAGVLMLLALDTRLNLLLVAPALAVRGLGAGLTQAPFANAATAASGLGGSSVVAGLYGTLRYSGLALGSAMTGILLEARLARYGWRMGDPFAALPAYRELWFVLFLLGLCGLALVWLMGRSSPRLQEAR